SGRARGAGRAPAARRRQAARLSGVPPRSHVALACTPTNETGCFRVWRRGGRAPGPRPGSGSPGLEVPTKGRRDAFERPERRVALSRDLELPVRLLADTEGRGGLLLGEPTTLARRKDGESDPHIQLGNDPVEGAASMSTTRGHGVAMLDGNK